MADDLSDTAAGAIARLDASLLQHGQDVILRATNSTSGQVTVRAFVRGYDPSQLVGGIVQGDKKVTISPTSLGAFGNPKANQFVVVDGVQRKIIGEPEYIRINGTMVRINITARGTL